MLPDFIISLLFRNQTAVKTIDMYIIKPRSNIIYEIDLLICINQTFYSLFWWSMLVLQMLENQVAATGSKHKKYLHIDR